MFILGFSLDSGIVDFLVFSHFLSYKTAAISHIKKSLGIPFTLRQIQEMRSAQMDSGKYSNSQCNDYRKKSREENFETVRTRYRTL